MAICFVSGVGVKMNNIILPSEKYIELTAALAEDILQATYLDTILIEEENGDIRYTDEAQERFNEHLEMVCHNLSAHGIYKIDQCDHCEDGYIKDEYVNCLGGGPREDFNYIILMTPCTHCNQADLDDDGQPDEAQEWHDFDQDC